MYRELGASRIGHIRLGRHNLDFLSEYGNGMQLDGASFIFHNRMTVYTHLTPVPTLLCCTFFGYSNGKWRFAAKLVRALLSV